MYDLTKIKGHLSTINKHKAVVTWLCFRCGLYKQGLLHDLSKYTPTELKTGFKYYQGFRSPIDAQKEAEGCSMSWLHHKGRNPHQLGILARQRQNRRLRPADAQTLRIRNVCDRVAASMIYQKEKYTDHSALDYYLNGRKRIMIHPETDRLILYLLCYLSENGLDKTCDYIRSLPKDD